MFAPSNYPSTEEARTERRAAALYGVLGVRHGPGASLQCLLILTCPPQLGIVILPLLRQRMLHGVKKLAQGRTGSRWQSQDPKSLLFNTILIFSCIEIDRFRMENKNK